MSIGGRYFPGHFSNASSQIPRRISTEAHPAVLGYNRQAMAHEAQLPLGTILSGRETPPRAIRPGPIRLGTSAFSADGWRGTFYPAGLKPVDFLGYYSTQFNTVEVDSTFYGIPSVATVRRWYSKTPPGFIFAAKVPQIITHEKLLKDAAEDLKQFLGVMDLLGEKLGPLLFQFPYFKKNTFAQPEDFFARLIPFLDTLPKGYRFAVEIRNKHFVCPAYVEALRERNLALALIDHPYMPSVSQLFQQCDPITADFTYVRWLGDRYAIEKVTEVWDRVVVDRTDGLSEWAKACQLILRRGVSIFAYANNHFAGHGPATIRQFEEIFGKLG
jgi:uncharacterized protein YecE (DUF72 family)